MIVMCFCFPEVPHNEDALHNCYGFYGGVVPHMVLATCEAAFSAVRRPPRHESHEVLPTPVTRTLLPLEAPPVGPDVTIDPTALHAG